MTRRSIRIGSLLLALYVAVAAATALWGPRHLRPLFDGFASHPGTYSWVKPPKEFAEGNGSPALAQVRVNVAADGSTPVIAETVDGQALASLPAAAVPPHGADTAATIELRPVDSGTLGALPAGLRPEGNAYKVSIAYLPSSAPVTGLAVPGTVGVTSKAPSDTLLFSPDGHSWRQMEGQALPDAKGFTGPIREVGYYLAAGHGSPRPLRSNGKNIPLALYLAAAAVPLILGYLLIGRRPRAAGPSTRGASGKERPSSRGRPTKRPPSAKSRKDTRR